MKFWHSIKLHDLQISICFRITMDDLDVQELFCGFYESTSTTSEELFKMVKTYFLSFSNQLINIEASATMMLPVFPDTLTDCV